MYISRIELDETNRETMRLLAMPHLLHGAIEQSFPGERQRRLWRLDRLSGRCFLLVLSKEQGDFTNLVDRYGITGVAPSWETKAYETLLKRLANVQVWHFRLCANPVRSVNEGEVQSRRGKIMAHVTPVQQKAWLMERAPSFGFTLVEDEFEVVHTQWLKFNKGTEREVTIRTATFEGRLTVTDPKRFQNTLVSGIGRAKAYGCGLMTIINVQE